MHAARAHKKCEFSDNVAAPTKVFDISASGFQDLVDAGPIALNATSPLVKHVHTPLLMESGWSGGNGGPNAESHMHFKFKPKDEDMRAAQSAGGRRAVHRRLPPG